MIDIQLIGGMLLSFFFTMAILSYLILDDNLLFRLGAYCLVGISAGYLFGVMVKSVVVDQYLDPLLSTNIPLLVLLTIMGIPLLFRLNPRGSSLAFLPMALLVGVGAAVVVGGSLTGTFLPQAVAAAEPGLLMPDPWSMLENWFVLLGTLATLAYFHFGARPRGGSATAPPPGVGPIAAVGKAFLAVTLGALYAGALLSALAILVERVYSLVETITFFL